MSEDVIFTQNSGTNPLPSNAAQETGGNLATLAGAVASSRVQVSIGSAGTLVPATITVGGTAQNLFGTTPANGFEIINTHATETLYIRENGTATAADNGASVAILPRNAYTTPPGYKPTGDISVIAATTGHALIGRRW
jgi:hypothetical protein